MGVSVGLSVSLSCDACGVLSDGFGFDVIDIAGPGPPAGVGVWAGETYLHGIEREHSGLFQSTMLLELQTLRSM